MWFKVGYVAATVSLAIVETTLIDSVAGLIIAVSGALGVVLGYLVNKRRSNGAVDPTVSALLRHIEVLERELEQERRRSGRLERRLLRRTR